MAKFAGICSLLLILFDASAQTPQSGVTACLKIADDHDRLACFDREAAAPPRREAKPIAPEQQLGLTKRQVNKLEPQAAPSEPPPPVAIDAYILQISQNSAGFSVFKLDNGQVWVQTETTAIAMHVGDMVVVSKGALGSFWLSAGKHISTRVRRIT